MKKKLDGDLKKAVGDLTAKTENRGSKISRPNQFLCVLTCFILGFFGSITKCSAQTNYTLNLNGSNQFVDVSDNASLNFGSSTDFTLEAQILLNGSNSSFNGLIAKGGASFPWAGYQIAVYQNVLVGEIGNGSTFVGTPEGLQGTTNLNDGNWHHVAMVVSRSSSNAKLYVDGNLEASVNSSVIANNISNTSDLYIGVERGLSNFFNGKMDEIRIWNTARTQAEIQANKYISINPSSSGLVSYYNCNEGSGTVLTDNKGSNTGTLENGTTWAVSTLVSYTYTASNNTAFRDIGINATSVNTSDISSQVYTYSGGIWSSYSGTMTPGVGYRALFNGNSSKTVYGTSVSNAITPSLNYGEFAFSFVANPYNAVLDIDALFSSTSGLQLGYWYFDPTNIVGGYEGYKFYGSLVGASNTYSNGLTLGRYIQPGQGFFVQNDGSGSSSLEFDPTQIVSGHTTNVFGENLLNRISAGLFKDGQNLDGAVVVFNSLFTSGYDKYDATKINNQGENLAFTIAGKDFCANAFSLPKETDELPMHLYNLVSNTTYTLKLDASQFVGNGLSAYLQDNLLNAKTLLVGANNEITFSTGTDVSTVANRYSILFASSLPVKNILLSATALANKQVALKWTTVGESNVASYKVERSTDGTTFTTLATISPETSQSYSFLDASVTESANYYRIKSTDNTGAFSYSNVQKVSIVNRSLLTVFPNPIIGTSFNLSLANTGKYFVNLIDKLGRTVYATTINHIAVASSENIVLNNKLLSGSYTVKVTDENGKVSNTEIIVK